MSESETQQRPYGEGIYRRRIQLNTEGSSVIGNLEDDFHRFRVRLEHDGTAVQSIVGESARYPWTTCPSAAAQLQSLVGMTLSESAAAAARHTDPRQQCTHFFDLASCTITHAASNRSTRTYDIEVPDRTDNKTSPKLSVDGRPVLAWEVEESKIVAPEPYAGRLIGAGFQKWLEATFDLENQEYGLLLRRACTISLGRFVSLDQYSSAGELGHRTLGICFSYQTENVDRARRAYGMTREFSTMPDRLLSNDGSQF